MEDPRRTLKNANSSKLPDFGFRLLVRRALSPVIRPPCFVCIVSCVSVVLTMWSPLFLLCSLSDDAYT